MPLISPCEPQNPVFTPPIQKELWRKERVIEQIAQDKKIKDNFNFPVDNNDIIFTLAMNPSIYKENVSNLITKMVIIKELSSINLDELSKVLLIIGIKELNIFSVSDDLEEMKIVRRNNCSSITYVEMKREHLIRLLNDGKTDFLDYNKYSLYILRNGGFLDIKNLFSIINGYKVNVGRGGSQKAHILSPLDFRLSSYLMAMFHCNYNKIVYLNDFNYLHKDRYLSYMDITYKKK